MTVEKRTTKDKEETVYRHHNRDDTTPVFYDACFLYQ